MLNSSSALPPTPNTPSTPHILEIEHTDNALKSWLQKWGREILPDSLFITVSMLFGWVDPLDLIVILQVSLRVVAMERQFQQEEPTCISFLLRGGRCYMEERMYRAQMEVTLFSKAIANLCEELDMKCRPPIAPLPENTVHGAYQAPRSAIDDFRSENVVHVNLCKELDMKDRPPPLPENTGYMDTYQAPRSVHCNDSRSHNTSHAKCQKWLSASSEFLVDFPQLREIPQLYEHVLRPNGRFLSLPFLVKSWVGSITYRAYITTFYADCADSQPIGINISDYLKAKKEKTVDVLKSDFHTLELKKHRAQAEVEMFSEAIARTSGSQYINRDTCSSHESDGTYESYTADNSSDDWFDDFSTSSGSSSASALF